MKKLPNSLLTLPSDIVIEGIEEIIKRDLSKHRAIVERTVTELNAFRAARAHEIKRKRHYASLIGGGKFNDAALRTSIEQINLNVRHLSDKVDAAEGILKFNQTIVDTLTVQLEEQNKGLARLAEYRRTNGAGH